MAMDFWAAQARAKRKTAWLIFVFIVLTFGVAYLANLVVHNFIEDPNNESAFPWVGVGFIALTFIVALFNYVSYRLQGGAYVAESLGAHRIAETTQNPHHRQLLNLVQEMAVAASEPMPAVFILQNDQINAFAAGTSPENACICVTTGSMTQLNRDELQAVIGHEMGHIDNQDMNLSMKLSAMLMGFFIIFYVAIRLIQFGPIRSRDSDSKTGPITIIALVMLCAGALSYVAGKILASMISRQREYLADASSVQFTRNADALISALKKIGKETDRNEMPKEGMAFSHLYFDHKSLLGIFSTHPSLEKRIQALQGLKK